MLTTAQLKSNVFYSPETGLFTRLSTQRITGNRHKYKKYIVITISKKRYYAHRLVWLYVTGVLPEGVIDHINGDKTDNRFENLRDISNKLNLQNRRTANKNTTTGILGVGNASGGRFKARICIDGRRIFLGRFSTIEEAQSAYLDAKRVHHTAYSH